MTDAAVLTALAAASLLLTQLCRTVAIRRHWFDLPNARSSHLVPTPKGGGLAFVLTFSAAVLYAWQRGYLDNATAAALAACLPLAATGFYDDLKNLTIRARMAVQALCVAGVLLLLGGVPALPLPGMNAELGVAGWLLGGLALLWLANLYNFMDGIDGIAALEAIFACLGAAFLLWRLDAASVFPPLALALSVGGFLVLNLPPARIFMGDTGSQWLGLVLGVLALWSAAQGLPLWCWAILLGVFIVDSSTTLLTRMIEGEIWYHPHRRHAYQRAARRWGSHGRVDAGVMSINIFWLLPLAWAAAEFPQWGILFTIAAYSPLIIVGKYWLAEPAESPEPANSQ